MQTPDLNAFIKTLHESEEAFLNGLNSLDDSLLSSLFNEIPLDIDTSNFDNLLYNGFEINASSIITQRMFIYNIERNMTNKVEKSMRTSNVVTYYNYLNDYLDKEDSPYRNLIKFEIDCLVKEDKLSKDNIEKYFIMDNSLLLSKLLKSAYKIEGSSIPQKTNTYKVEEYLLDLGINRKTALKFCIAAMAKSYQKDDPDIDLTKYISDKFSDKFNNFYDWIIDYQIHDGNERHVLIVALDTFSYMFESFKL